MAGHRLTLDISRLPWLARIAVWRRESLQRWLLGPVILVTAVLAITALVVLYHYSGWVVARWHGQVLVDSAGVAAHTVEQQVEAMVSASQRLAQRGAAGLAGSGLQAEGDALGMDVVAHAGADGVVSIVVPAGAADIWAEAVTGVLASESYLRSSVSDATQSDTVVGAFDSSGLPVIYAAAPLGSGEGVLVAARRIEQLLATAQPNVQSALVFYSGSGVPVQTTLPLPTGDLPITDLVAATRGGFVREAKLLDENYRYTLLPVEYLGVRLGYLGVWQATRDSARTTLELRLILALVVSAVALGLIAVSVSLARQILTPVRLMVESGRAMASGRPATSEIGSTSGELGELASVFQDMAQQVQRQNTALALQARRSEYISRASTELGGAFRLDDALQIAAEAIYGLGYLSYVIVMTGHGELGPYVCRAVRGFAYEPAGRMLGREYPVPLWGVMARALVSRQPLLINDVQEEKRPRLGEFDWDVTRGSILLYPVSTANDPFALIVAGIDEPGALEGDGRGEVLLSLANIASQSIRNAHLYEQAARAREQLLSMQVISRLSNSAKQAEDVLQGVVHEAVEVMGADRCWVYLPSETGPCRLTARQGTLDGGELSRPHTDAAGWVMRAAQPLFYDAEQGLPSTPILADRGTAMCVPLEILEESIGVLIVVSRSRQMYHEDDMIVLRTLANAAAAALRTVRLTEQLGESASQDVITGQS